eukprot:3439276-Prymnesium_polylepis.1
MSRRLRLRVVDPQRVHRRLEPPVQLCRPHEPRLLHRPPTAHRRVRPERNVHPSIGRGDAKVVAAAEDVGQQVGPPRHAPQNAPARLDVWRRRGPRRVESLRERRCVEAAARRLRPLRALHERVAAAAAAGGGQRLQRS